MILKLNLELIEKICYYKYVKNKGASYESKRTY